MLEALQKGDEVVTAGGVLGRIAKLTDQYATVEIAPNTEITVQRGAISQLLPKGTIKALLRSRGHPASGARLPSARPSVSAPDSARRRLAPSLPPSAP